MQRSKCRVTESALAFLITPDSFQAIPLEVSPETLEQELTLFRDFTEDDPHPQSLQQLHQHLIAPIKPHLKTSNLIIVPHGFLHYLPFAALSNGQRYLADDYTISYLPSASVLRFLNKNKPTNNNVLALGNPRISAPLGFLEHADDEAEAVANIFNSKAFNGKDAQESLVYSQGKSAAMIHLAAHGQYNNRNPLYSTIHLAPTPEEDGRLEVHEIFGLDLTTVTNLVVLSACQTNLAEVNPGEDVVAMNRAFLYAGTPAVVASLWNVDDEATGILMKSFYSHLKAGMNKAEALQQAQKELR